MKKSIVSRARAALLSRHAKYTPDYSPPAVDRSFSRVGLQHGLGLLSVRRNRIGAADRPDPRAARQNLTRALRSDSYRLVTARRNAAEDSPVPRFRGPKSRLRSK